ncbi:MAG TPA: hypothetical protein VH206_20085 [Xanthobacteraceae bacterium]|nr:hypothetical protein [Xanthobacteraceae bacterium]
MLPELATSADYGPTLLSTNSDHATALVTFILSQDKQKLLAKNGFEAPLLVPRK